LILVSVILLLFWECPGAVIVAATIVCFTFAAIF